MNSFFLSLGKSDFLKGLIVAAGTAAMAVLAASLNAGKLPGMAELKFAGAAALAAGIAYLGKNFFTNSSGNIGPEKPESLT
jgi:hypothetical protein